MSNQLPNITFPQHLDMFWLRQFAPGDPFPSAHPMTRSLCMTFVIQVQNAITEYQNAHQHYARFWASRNALAFGALHSVQYHLSALVCAMHLACACYKAMLENPTVDTELQTFLKNVTPVFLDADVVDGLRLMRNEIQHIDEKITKGVAGNGAPLLMSLSDDNSTMSLGRRELKVDTVCDALVKLSIYADRLRNYKPLPPMPERDPNAIYVDAGVINFDSSRR